jgi:hypothetical protein
VNKATVSVATRSLPVISITASADTVCPGEPVILSASGGVTYTWSPGNIASPGFTVQPYVSAVYLVTATGINLCRGNGFVTIVVDGCTKIRQQLEENEFMSLYPVPAHNEIWLKYNYVNHRKITMVNGVGIVVKQWSSDRSMEKVDLEEFSDGLYMVVVETADLIQILKFVKDH